MREGEQRGRGRLRKGDRERERGGEGKRYIAPSLSL